MRYIKKRNQWESPNVTLNADKLEAYSYRWWKFLAKIGKKVVFNNYRYSVSTSKHQRKVLNQLDSLGIKVDLFLDFPEGIDSSGFSSSKTHYEFKIKELEAAIAKTGSRKSTNAQRLDQIKYNKQKLKELAALLKVYDKQVLGGII
jgi:hypothetical protein